MGFKNLCQSVRNAKTAVVMAKFAARARATYYVYYCLNLRIPDCLLLNIIIIVAVFVVKCCDSRDCLIAEIVILVVKFCEGRDFLLMLLFLWLN